MVQILPCLRPESIQLSQPDAEVVHDESWSSIRDESGYLGDYDDESVELRITSIADGVLVGRISRRESE